DEALRLERVREQDRDAARRGHHSHAWPLERRRSREMRRGLDEEVQLGHLEQARGAGPRPPGVARTNDGARVRASGAQSHRGRPDLRPTTRVPATGAPPRAPPPPPRPAPLLNKAPSGAAPPATEEPLEVLGERQIRLVPRRDEQAHAETPIGRSIDQAAAEPA